MEVAGNGGTATRERRAREAQHAKPQKTLHRITDSMVASFLFSMAACATPAPPGSLLAIKQEQRWDLYKQCMQRDFMQAPIASALPLQYIAERCQAWAHTKAF